MILPMRSLSNPCRQPKCSVCKQEELVLYKVFYNAETSNGRTLQAEERSLGVWTWNRRYPIEPAWD